MLAVGGGEDVVDGTLSRHRVEKKYTYGWF